MKQLIVIFLVLLASTSLSYAQEAAPFQLKHYGHFKKMMHMKKTAGVVGLTPAINQPNLYGVGASAHGTGEITILNSRLWLDYGVDGLGNAKHIAGENEKAVILVTAKVSKWRDFTIPKDMNAKDLHEFVLKQAQANGLDIQKPFPFLMVGDFYSVDWHVLNGLKPKNGHSNAGSGGHKGLYKKVKVHLPAISGNVVGFYSAANQGVYTHPGESWHQHLIVEKNKQAGHIDGFSVRKGTILKLPEE